MAAAASGAGLRCWKVNLPKQPPVTQAEEPVEVEESEVAEANS